MIQRAINWLCTTHLLGAPSILDIYVSYASYFDWYSRYRLCASRQGGEREMGERMSNVMYRATYPGGCRCAMFWPEDGRIDDIHSSLCISKLGARVQPNIDIAGPRELVDARQSGLFPLTTQGVNLNILSQKIRDSYKTQLQITYVCPRMCRLQSKQLRWMSDRSKTFDFWITDSWGASFATRNVTEI